MKNKTTELSTLTQSDAEIKTKIDSSTKYEDYSYSIKSKDGKEKTIEIKNYTDENGEAFEINGISIFGEHLKLLRDFINNNQKIS